MELNSFVRTLAAQPESMGISKTGPLALEPMGEKRGGLCTLSYIFLNI